MAKYVTKSSKKRPFPLPDELRCIVHLETGAATLTVMVSMRVWTGVGGRHLHNPFVDAFMHDFGPIFDHFRHLACSTRATRRHDASSG